LETDSVEKTPSIPKISFSVLKLKTGETLFCETSQNPNNNRYIDVNDPFLVKVIGLDDNTESLYAAKWIPFTAYTRFSIPVDSILALAPLSRSYKHFYGLTFLKNELYDLNNVTINRIMKGESKQFVISDMIPRMDATFASITKRFGPLEFDMMSFKAFVEKSVEDVNAANFNFEAFEEDTEENEKDSKPILH